MQYCRDFSRIRLDAFLAHHMTQKSDGLSSKATLAWVEFQIHFPKLAEHCIQMLDVLTPSLTVDIEVVNKDLQKCAPQVLEHLSHGSSESARCVL